MPDYFDAIVVGSGISGGWAAKELTEKGMRTLLLERGRNVVHIKDYPHATLHPWELPHRGSITQHDRHDHLIQQRNYAFDEASQDFFVNDVLHPYQQQKPFEWYRGYQVGGRSLTWGRQSYRWSDLDFAANRADGTAIDWPLRYRELAPWYDYVERFVGVSGNRDGLPQLPDGIYLPPMQMSVAEQAIAKRIQERYGNRRHMIIGRTANHSQKIGNRGPCQYRNRCQQGCPFSGYFSTQSATLPAALATGKLTLRPDSIVTRLLYDRKAHKVTGVEILDAHTKQTIEYKSRIVFLNASAFNSAWVLMNSATEEWPEGLGSSSGQLGRNVMDHHTGIRISGIIEGFDDKYVFGRRPTGIYIPRYRNLAEEGRSYVRGFGFQGSAGRQGWNRNADEKQIGPTLKETLIEPGAWTVSLSGFGETLPYAENHIRLDHEHRDKWGLPQLSVHIQFGENEKKMRTDMLADAAEMLHEAGVKEIEATDRGAVPGRGIHEMGTARMGADARHAVLNRFNQVWDAPNVFVTDGACMVSSACQNPSLTYMALTARAVDYAVSEMKKQNL